MPPEPTESGTDTISISRSWGLPKETFACPLSWAVTGKRKTTKVNPTNEPTRQIMGSN